MDDFGEHSIKVHVTSKGRITIPSSIRKRYGLEPGTKILVSDSTDGIILTPVTKHYVDNLRGSLKGSGALEVLISERQKDRLREE